jgi:hypothetical protein
MARLYLVALLVLFSVAISAPRKLEAQSPLPPPPPAVAADPDLIALPRLPVCEQRCRERGDQEVCGVSICVGGEYPLLQLDWINAVELYPGDSFTLYGSFGAYEENLSIALAEEQEDRFYHRLPLQW